jgi:ferredoxin
MTQEYIEKLRLLADNDEQVMRIIRERCQSEAEKDGHIFNDHSRWYTGNIHQKTFGALCQYCDYCIEVCLDRPTSTISVRKTKYGETQVYNVFGITLKN